MQLDASERKTKALYDHMDDINTAMDESENILKSLDDEIKQKQAEEKKDKGKEDEVNENAEEAREDEDSEKKDKSPDLNKFVDQISVSTLNNCQLNFLETPRQFNITKIRSSKMLILMVINTYYYYYY